jgi:hypothetical protein
MDQRDLLEARFGRLAPREFGKGGRGQRRQHGFEPRWRFGVTRPWIVGQTSFVGQKQRHHDISRFSIAAAGTLLPGADTPNLARPATETPRPRQARVIAMSIASFAKSATPPLTLLRALWPMIPLAGR